MYMLTLLAQAAAAASPEAVAVATQGVTPYPPAFFAAQQPNTALEMLRRIPGFSVDRGNSVRGFEGAAGNVLIDGKRPSSKTDSLEDILNRIPAGRVERIDVIRGGAPGIDMQGKTVLANVVLKRGGGFRGAIALSDMHTHDNRDLVGLRLEGSATLADTSFEGSFRSARGLDDGNGDGEGTRFFANGDPTVRAVISQEGDSIQYVGAGSVETSLLGGRLRVNGRVFTDDFKGEEEYRIFAPSPALETNFFGQDTDETEIGGRFSRPLMGMDLELIALRQTRDRRITNEFAAGGDTTRFVLDRYTTESIGRGVLRRRFTDTLSFEAGGEAALNTLDSQTRLAFNGAAIPLPAANVQVEEFRSEAFVKGTWRPLPAWTVDGGIRYESSTISSEGDVVLEKTLHFLKPRLAVTWAPSETTQVRLLVERVVGQLNFNDFVASSNLNTAGGVSAGNPDLDPEQAWVAEAAFEQRFWDRGIVVFTARHSELKDVVDRAPLFVGGGVFDRPANIGEGTKDELALEVTLPLDRLGMRRAQLKGDVTKRWMEVTDPTTLTPREISGLRHLDWNVSLSQDLPRWNLTWGFDAFGSFKETYYRYNTVQVFKLNTFVRPYVEWRPRRDVSIRFEVHNITTRDLRDTFYIYPGPRSEGGVPDIEDRYIPDTAQGFTVRLRKNFGG